MDILGCVPDLTPKYCNTRMAAGPSMTACGRLKNKNRKENFGSLNILSLFLSRPFINGHFPLRTRYPKTPKLSPVGRVSTGMGDRLGILRALDSFFLFARAGSW